MAHRRPQANKLTVNELIRFRLPSIHVPAVLPAGGAAPTDDPLDAEFAEIAQRVAAAARPLDAIKESAALSRGVDLYAGLKRAFRGYGFPAATNATLKMHELIIQMGLIDCGGRHSRVRAFCDAELPGAFIMSINHFVRTMCPAADFDWVGSSYFPAAAAASGDNTILGDQYGLYAQHRDHWLMGPRPNALPAGEPDASGDLTDADTVAQLADAVHARFAASDAAGSGATLATSDAGIDVSEDFSKQESLTARLNFGQVLAAVLALAPGGHLVTKTYTFTAPFSRSVIALVAALFDESYIVKPLTSRPSNSEVYLVGKGFRGPAVCTPQLAEQLLDRLAASDAPCDGPPLFDPADYAAVDRVLIRATRQIHGRQQVAFLDEMVAFNARYASRYNDLARDLSHEARRVQEHWLLENPVRQIRPESLLITS